MIIKMKKVIKLNKSSFDELRKIFEIKKKEVYMIWVIGSSWIGFELD